MRTAIAFVLLASVGCASIFNSSHTSLDVISHPGADVTLDGQPVGRSPMTVEMSNHATHVIVLGDVRHPVATCTLEPHLGIGWVFLDFFAGIWPLVVDAATGDWRSVDTGECGAYR